MYLTRSNPDNRQQPRVGFYSSCRDSVPLMLASMQGPHCRPLGPSHVRIGGLVAVNLFPRSEYCRIGGANFERASVTAQPLASKATTGPWSRRRRFYGHSFANVSERLPAPRATRSRDAPALESWSCGQAGGAEATKASPAASLLPLHRRSADGYTALPCIYDPKAVLVSRTTICLKGLDHDKDFFSLPEQKDRVIESSAIPAAPNFFPISTFVFKVPQIVEIARLIKCHREGGISC